MKAKIKTKAKSRTKIIAIVSILLGIAIGAIILYAVIITLKPEEKAIFIKEDFSDDADLILKDDAELIPLLQAKKNTLFASLFKNAQAYSWGEFWDDTKSVVERVTPDSVVDVLLPGASQTYNQVINDPADLFLPTGYVNPEDTYNQLKNLFDDVSNGDIFNGIAEFTKEDFAKALAVKLPAGSNLINITDKDVKDAAKKALDELCPTDGDRKYCNAEDVAQRVKDILGGEGTLNETSGEGPVPPKDGGDDGVNDGDVNQDQYKKLKLASSKNSFGRDLSEDKTNYFCPESLKTEIASKDLVISSSTDVKSEWLKSDSAKLNKFVKVKLGGQEIDLDKKADTSEILWSDLVRWKSENPDVILTQNDGSVIPVSKGETKVQAGVCGKPSNEITIKIDDSVDEKTSFNNITTAGIGTSKHFFENNFNNRILLSKELTETHPELDLQNNKITKIEGALGLYKNTANYSYENVKAENLKMYFSFDAGQTFMLVNLVKDSEINFTFSADVNQENTENLSYVLVYQFNKQSDKLTEKAYDKTLSSSAITGVPAATCFSCEKTNEKVLFLDPSSTLYLNQLTSENIFSANLIKEPVSDQIEGSNPGIANFQIGTINSAATVSLPPTVYLDALALKLTTIAEEKTGKKEDVPLDPNDQEKLNQERACDGKSDDPAFKDANENSLIKELGCIDRGANREIVKWKVKEDYKNKSLTFKYKKTQSQDQLQEAKVYYNSKDGYYYAVLKDLEGGEFVDKNDQGFENGRMFYSFQISSGENYAEAQTVKTLNRFQAILYYYKLVFGDDFNLVKNEQVDKNLRNGGPTYFYKTEGQEPMSLKGIHFTLLNDRKFEEFDNRLTATAKKYDNLQAVKEIYGRVLDRIYDDNLDLSFDEVGAKYWTSQIEQKNKNKIDILSAKFAVSVSPEYTGEEAKTKQGQADLAYQIVLKRGADQKGLRFLEKLPSEKEMRAKLAESEEYNSRLTTLEANRGKAAAVKELYETLYARAADVDGVIYWTKSDMPILEIKKDFLNSAEFKNVAQ